MSDIYNEWLQHRTLHHTQKHELKSEDPISDFACRRCYPITGIDDDIINEFLKFWKILCKIET